MCYKLHTLFYSSQPTNSASNILQVLDVGILLLSREFYCHFSTAMGVTTWLNNIKEISFYCKASKRPQNVRPYRFFPNPRGLRFPSRFLKYNEWLLKLWMEHLLGSVVVCEREPSCGVRTASRHNTADAARVCVRAARRGRACLRVYRHTCFLWNSTIFFSQNNERLEWLKLVNC